MILSLNLYKVSICHSGESQNLVAKKYKKAIVIRWIPDEEPVNKQVY